jgi:hypothetical protein
MTRGDYKDHFPPWLAFVLLMYIRARFPDGIFPNQKKIHVGIFYVHLEYFTAIGHNCMAVWCIFWLFGVFFPVLVCCDLATLPLC